MTSIVCGCAVATWWYNTHPESPIKQKIVQIKQGDGYMTEKQCHQVGHDKLRDVREKYGVAAETDDGYWNYPIRDDEERHCVVHFDFNDDQIYGPKSKVMSVDLELLTYAID